MRASSSSSTLPFVPSASSNTSATPPPSSSSDTKTSFAEVLHQQGGDKPDPSKTTTADPGSDSPTTVKTSTTSTTDTPPVEGATITAIPPAATLSGPKTLSAAQPTIVKNKPIVTALPTSSDLGSMIVQAAAQAVKTQPGAPTPKIPGPTKGTTTDSAPALSVDSTTTGGLDLTTLIAQAAVATSQVDAARTAVSASPTSPVVTAAATATVPATAIPIGTTAAAAGTGLPLTISTKAPKASSEKEKKSASVQPEGSFLQSGTAASNSISSPLASLVTVGSPGTENPLNQNIANAIDSKKSVSSDPVATTLDAAGTVNDKDDTDMTTSLRMAGIAIGNPTPGADTPAADVHVHLSTNSDFNSALKQVVEVTSLSGTTSLRAPLRVAMELQTPPGAVVNVYISKQTDGTDGYRAQLSTNDPAALSWVQNKLSELRETNDFGVNVKWLPAQTESTTTVSSTSSSNNDGLSWDRGGQNQQRQQEQNERQSARQQKGDLFPGMPSLASHTFMTQLNSLGRAA